MIGLKRSEDSNDILLLTILFLVWTISRRGTSDNSTEFEKPRTVLIKGKFKEYYTTWTVPGAILDQLIFFLSIFILIWAWAPILDYLAAQTL